MEFLWALLISLLIAIGILLWRESQYRHQVRHLIARLDELELDSSDVDIPGPAPSPETENEITTRSKEHPEADVLHGRTTFVRRLLEGESRGDLRQEEQAILAIYENIRETYSPTALSEDLCISLRTLERVLLQELGCSPRELIIAVKMREALRLMREEGLSVTASSYRLGFSSPSHFSRRFKAFYRKPPSQMADRGLHSIDQK